MSTSPPRRRPSLTAAARRLEAHQTPLGLFVLAVTGLLVWISIVSINGIPFSSPLRVRAVFPAAGPIVKRGDDVLIAGERVGEVRGVRPVADGRLVLMDVSRSSVIGRGAGAWIRLRGLAGATYVELMPGDTAHRAPDGFTIPLRHTGTNTQLTDVVAQFDAAARRDMSQTLSAYGAGVAGRGSAVNQALADLPQLAAQGQPVLRSLVPEPGALSGLLAALDGTTVGLAGSRPGDLAGLLVAFHRSFDALLSQRPALSRMIDGLRPLSDQAQATLPIAEPVLNDAAAAVRTLEPAAADLQRALPNLNALLEQSAAVGQLRRLAHALDPVLGRAGPVLGDLWPGAASLSPLAAAAAPFLRYTAPYGSDILLGPEGFTSAGWGGFSYAAGQATGHRAVRFAPVFTCTPGRDPYPGPARALEDRRPCPF